MDCKNSTLSGKTSFTHWRHFSTGWPVYHSWELHTSSVGPPPLCGVPQSTAGHTADEDWKRRWEQSNTQAILFVFPLSHVLGFLGLSPLSFLHSSFHSFLSSSLPFFFPPQVICVPLSYDSLLFLPLPDSFKVVMDRQEFESPHYQRVYQYLWRHIENINLDRFSYIGNVEGTPANCMEIILQWVEDSICTHISSPCLHLTFSSPS